MKIPLFSWSSDVLINFFQPTTKWNRIFSTATRRVIFREGFLWAQPGWHVLNPRIDHLSITGHMASYEAHTIVLDRPIAMRGTNKQSENKNKANETSLAKTASRRWFHAAEHRWRSSQSCLSLHFMDFSLRDSLLAHGPFSILTLSSYVHCGPVEMLCLMLKR